MAYNDRLQIYVNGELTEEFIYSDRGQLLEETTFSMQNDCIWESCNNHGPVVGEVYKYFYRSDDQLDYAEVYSLDYIELRQVRYHYDDQNQLYGIDYTIKKDGHWVSHFDYDCGGMTVKAGEVYQSTKFENCGRTDCWTGTGEIIPPYDFQGNNNVTFIYVPSAYGLIYLEYDDQKNPIYEFAKNSRILPIRMSANNPLKITYKYPDVGAYPPKIITHHIVTIEYQYDDSGRPISAIRTTTGYNCQTDLLEYVYDKIRK